MHFNGNKQDKEDKAQANGRGEVTSSPIPPQTHKTTSLVVYCDALIAEYDCSAIHWTGYLVSDVRAYGLPFDCEGL